MNAFIFKQAGFRSLTVFASVLPRLFSALFISAYAALCLISCRQSAAPFFGGYEKVCLTIPECCRRQTEDSQTERPSRNAYFLYADENMRMQKIIIKKNQMEVSLFLPKNRVTPFLFYADQSDTEPLGCVYPFSVRAEVSSGFTAFILYRLLLLSHNSPEDVYAHASRFNWAKLDNVIRGYENPWALDSALIAEKIAAGTFSLRNIKEK